MWLTAQLWLKSCLCPSAARHLLGAAWPLWALAVPEQGHLTQG